MNTFQVCGYSDTGKTTLIVEIIKRLLQQHQQVGSIKSIHAKNFHIDQPGTDTCILGQTGANPVVACGFAETDFLYQHRMDFLEITHRISADWLIVEGFNDFPLPKIVCVNTEADLDDFIDRRTFAISGIISQYISDYKGIPVYNSLNSEQMDKLVGLVKQKTFPLLPYVDDDCCQLCGLTCAKFVEAMIQGEKSYEDCTIRNSTIQLKIGGRDIPMVPFVQRILRNSVTGIVSELSGWETNRKIEIIIE